MCTIQKNNLKISYKTNLTIIKNIEFLVNFKLPPKIERKQLKMIYIDVILIHDANYNITYEKV